MGSKRYKFSRYAMYTRIQEFFDGANLEPGKCLLVGDTLEGKGGDTSITDMLPVGSKIMAAGYPEVDIQDMPYENNTFDYVIADQVIEHVRKPWIGVEEVRRVLKPGGIAVLTSALIFYLHGVPHDYWRFTPDGLRVLCENFSIVHRCAGTGDLDFAFDILRDKKSTTVTPGSELEKRALACNDKHLVSVWIIAEK